MSVQALRALGATLVEIHGQHDDRALVDPAAHRALLDAYGGLAPEVGRGRRRLGRGARPPSAALAEHIARVEAARREADYLRHAAEELGAARAGDRRGRGARRKPRRHDARREGGRGPERGLRGGRRRRASPRPTIANAIRRLERRSAASPELVEPAIKALDAALLALDEARGASATPRSRRPPSIRSELERIEERLFALRAASRKFQVPADGLAALAEKFRADLADLDAGEAELTALKPGGGGHEGSLCRRPRRR